MGNLLNVSCFPGKCNFRVSALSANPPRSNFPLLPLHDKIDKRRESRCNDTRANGTKQIRLNRGSFQKAQKQNDPHDGAISGRNKGRTGVQTAAGAPLCALLPFYAHSRVALGKILVTAQVNLSYV